MSNNYFVTISLPPTEFLHYKTIIKRIYKSRYNKKIVVTQQKGKNNHLHYHLIVGTDEYRTNYFRQTFRTYFNPLKITNINLNIKKIDVIGKTWNYLHRDPTTKVVTSRGYDLSIIKAEAVANPDYKKKFLAWGLLVPKLKSLGYQFPERPGKYLKLLSKEYDVYPIICNPKKLAIILRFEGTEDASHYDDVFVTQDNRLTLL